MLGLAATGFIGEVLFAFGGAVLLLVIIMAVRRM
jgi:hypothetical protein